MFRFFKENKIKETITKNAKYFSQCQNGDNDLKIDFNSQQIQNLKKTYHLNNYEIDQIGKKFLQTLNSLERPGAENDGLNKSFIVENKLLQKIIDEYISNSFQIRRNISEQDLIDEIDARKFSY